eukprot:s169_g19.t1
MFLGLPLQRKKNQRLEVKGSPPQWSQHSFSIGSSGAEHSVTGRPCRQLFTMASTDTTPASLKRKGKSHKARTLQESENTRCFPKPCVAARNLMNVAELCSGIGCLGVGLEECGFQVKVRSDWNESMMDLSQKIHSTPTLLGDVTTDSLLANLSEQYPDVGGLAAGVSCQPYSRLGDQKQDQDIRAQTFPAMLRMTFLGQYGFTVLECVKEAGECAWIQRLLKQFSAETGYHVSQETYHLQHVWPTRRSRWWCVLSHPSIGPIRLQPCPEVSPRPMITHVLSSFQECDAETLRQLQLDLYELGKFAAFGFESNMIPWRGQMATSLHSCGNQLMGCPCGCRAYPFTEKRLQQGGLHGLLVMLPGESRCGNNVYPNFRHITPDELAFLNGMFPGCNWGPQCRMALCALGQLASPLQSAWVGACVMQHIHQILGASPPNKPEVVLLRLMGELLKARDETFGKPTTPDCISFSNMVFSMSFTQTIDHQPVSARPIPPDQPSKFPLEDHNADCLFTKDQSRAISPFTTKVNDQVSLNDSVGDTANPRRADSHDSNLPSSLSHPLPGASDQCKASEAGLGFHQIPVNKALSGSRTRQDSNTLASLSNFHSSASDQFKASEAGLGIHQVPCNLIQPEPRQGTSDCMTDMTSFAVHNRASACLVQSDRAATSACGSPFSSVCPEKNPFCTELSVEVTSRKAVDADSVAMPTSTPLKDRNEMEKPQQTFPTLAKIHDRHPDATNAMISNINEPGDTKQLWHNHPENLADRAVYSSGPFELRTENKHPLSVTRESPVHQMNKHAPCIPDSCNGEFDPLDTPPPQGEHAHVLHSHKAHPNRPMSPYAMPVKPLRGPGPSPESAGSQEHATFAFQVTSTSQSLPRQDGDANQESDGPFKPAEVSFDTDTRRGKPNQSLNDLGDEPKQPLELTESANTNKRKEVNSLDPIQLEVQAIANIAEATNQMLHIAPPTIGGVMGFESNKRARISPAQQVSNLQITQLAEGTNTTPPLSTTLNTTLAIPSVEVKSPEEHSSKSSIPSTERELPDQEGAQCEIPVPAPEDTSEAIQQSPQMTLRQGMETIVIFVKHEDGQHPIPYTVAVDMTVRKLTHAETKLGTFAIPVVPRSLVGTHVPLDADMHANQYVFLHQQMPPSLRCPFVSSKFAGQPQSLDLGLPCTRFEALWRQQAWVATDEMDYYLEAVQLEDKALPFPTSVFLNESEAAEWAHEWLAVAMLTNATDKPWCSAAIVDRHWIPIVIKHDQDHIQVSTTPEGNCFVPQVHAIAHKHGKTVKTHQKILPQAFAADCGFQALAWMIALVNDLKVEPLPPCKASQWRHLFVRELCRTNRGHDRIHQLAVGGSAPATADIRQELPPQADMPTAALPRQFAQIEVRTAGQSFKMFGEVGIGILDVLKCLTDESIPTIRAVTVQDEHLGQVPLQESRSLTPQGITLFVDSPCQMLLCEQDVIASNWPFVVVLHSLGILILKRHAGFMCFDVETAVESFDFEWEAPLLDYVGNRMIEDSIVPNIVFLGTTAKILDFWEMLRHPIAFRDLAQGFVTRIPQNQVHAFIHWIEKIGVHALVRSCGWQFLTQLNQDPPTVPLEVYLLPCSDRLPVAPRALCQLVIERIFINQLKFHAANPMLGENVRVSLKLWRTWVWTGQIGDGENTQFIHNAWLLAHRFFGDSTPIRLVSQGNQLNPDWPISHYLQTTGTGDKILKLHAVLQMHGGGPSPEQPPRTIHEAYSFQELEDLEQADANRLISILIQNLMEVPADEQHMDLEVIRSSTLRQDGPSFTMVGSVSTVIRFMRDLSATGIEALLRAMGWVTAMSISDSRPPVQVQLHLMPKAGVRHLALTTVRSFLAHALTIRAMPIPVGADGDITVKVKLADSWVLVGRFPPEVRMSIFIDPWYQATSFFGQPTRLRIICNSAQVNPDRCLEEYTRTNELGERFAKLFLVLQLQGGGPKATDREESEDCPSGKPMQTILLTVPRDEEHRLVRMHPEACIREALAQIRPGELTADWIPRDSFGFPYDWDMRIHDIACIHFIHSSDTPDESNGLLFLLYHQSKTGVQELEFYLRARANESTYKPIAPICVTAARGSHMRNQQLKQWLEDVLEHAMASDRPVASLCLVDQHWIPFVAHVSFDVLQVQTTVAGMDLLPQIERCCRRPHQPMPHSPPLWLRLPVNFMTRQHQVTFPHDCGFQAIVWLMNHICTRRPTEPLTMAEALQWRNHYLQHFACWDAANLFSLPMTRHLGGAETDPPTQGDESRHGQIHEQQFGTDLAGIPHGSEACSCISTWGETAEHVQIMPNHEALGMYDAWIGARLCAKSYNQLRNMPAPNPTNDEQLEAIRECLMNRDHRVQLLKHQDNLWADDEVLYHLQAITAMTGSENTQVLDPLLARAWALQEPGQKAKIRPHSLRVVTALHFQSHWTPVIFDKQGNFLNIHTLAQPNPKSQALESLVHTVQRSMGCTAFRWILYHTRDVPNDTCGILTIALTGHVLLRLPLPHGADQVMQLGHMLRKRFAKNLPEFCGLPYLWATGLSGAKHDPEMLQQLASLLKDHGVWADRTIDRATTLLESIPLSTIRSTFQSKRPWTDLKHAANQAKPPIKLIQQDELDAQIANRALHRNQFGRKPNKTSAKRGEPPKEPFTISASALEVPPGVFKQQDGTLLGPLRADQIGPNSEGVVLVDQADSHAALKLPRPVTQKGLAVLVLANKENSTMHEGDPIRFPAMCTTTQEPLIAAGYLYQMGTQAVQRNEPQNKLAVDERNTEAIRCIVFRDQVGAMWDDVVTHPVRTIFAQETLLRPQGPEDSPVIDVWDRQWVTKRYEKTKAKGADMFLFSFRMLAEHAPELISKSGTNGIYYEPRSSCGRMPNNSFHVTWLPSATYQEAKYAQQTSPQTTSLVRHADRYGFRSDALNAQEIHMKHRPETPLLLGQHKMLYVLGPLPYSTTKQAVTKILKAWNWDARPLQPRGRSQDGSGIQWTIQATSDPSHWIYVLQHGDVLISKVQEERQIEPPAAYSIVASKRTMLHLNQSDQSDPWLLNDPWKQPAKKTNGNVPPAPMNLPPSVLASIETNVEKRLLATLTPKVSNGDQDMHMEGESIECRVSQLEQQLMQVQAGQASIEQRIGHVVSDLFRSLTMLVVFFCLHIRLGEALVPGPHLFANANPTGLRGKSATLAALSEYSATFAVQETHLTAQGIGSFKKEIHWQQTKFHMTQGAPAPPKNTSAKTIGGKQTGVAFLSHYPLRSLNHHWTQEDHATGRCLATAAYINQRWVTMGTVYGYSEGAHTLEVQQNTDRLLQGLTSRVVDGAHGLRMISGDWNMDREHITQAEHWETKGWIEAQHLAQMKWQKPIQCTCKRTTVKDFLYLSPEMIPYVTDIQLNWTTFADHAVILVFLSDIDRPPLVPMWRKPKPIPWGKPPPAMPPWQCQAEYHQDMDVWYRRIWEDVEAYADHLSQITSGRQLQAHQQGRAATTEVVWSDCQVAPVKPNRRGDIQATLDCSNMMHARWTKQVRRLQHFSRLAGSASSITVMEHRISLWRKIRLAPGFQDDFCTWWSRQNHVFQTTPQTLPLHPPDAEVATQIYLEFSRQYRELEHSLRKARTEFAITRRKNDPMLIYKDVQRDKAEPVQTIVQQSSIQIAHKEVKPDACIITLQEPLPEGMTTIDVKGIPVQHTPLSKIQIALPPGVDESIGDKIVTRKLVGDIPAILDAFEEEWAPRWRRHDNVNDEVWSEVLAFLKAAIPKGQTTFPPITPELWNQTLKGKRKAAAIGPDGVSKLDLQSMPPTCLDQLLCLLREVEAGQPWPTQTTTGTVAALAKVPGAEVVQQFRPICIFSMTYRVWSSVRARQCLRYLQRIVPSTLMGNIPGRSPKKIWFHIQQCIEHSYGVGEEIAGTNIDLVKCFNTLPRAILQDLAAHVGLPSEVMVPWTQALRQITRRFQIRGATGRPIPSSTGYPEGCALSVVAMVVCNIGLEVWMYHRYPRAQVWSFVDNIEALARAARDAIDAMRGLSEFCTMLDIKVDQSKSYCWSTTAEGRKQIVDEGINRKYHCRDLGGHMNYSRQATNVTIQDKIHACQPFWNKLARSCAPVVQKERALYVAAWANIFYGISTVTLGSNHYAKLRTLATKSLNLHQMGSSPALQLSCISHPCTDPELYCILATILSFRDFQTPDLSDITLRATSEGSRTVPGPCKSFLAAIHKLAWTWHCNDHCTDQDGLSIFFMRCPRSELSERVILAWQQRILAISEHERTTMQGLSAADARLTKEVFRLQPSDSLGLLRCALNGTQFTQDALCHAGKVENPKCKFCDKVDSIHHRHASCAFFEDIRAKYQIVSEATNLPDSALCHGWIPRPQHLLEFRRSLLRIPDMTGDFMHMALPEELQYVDLFLDGSCLRPHDPFTRLASWGVVVWNSQRFAHIACGGVPGWKQTSLRAEITACISALKYLAHGDRPGRLWIDNQQVYHCLSTWLNGNDIPLEKKQDADLWMLLRDQYRQSYQFVSSVHKVSAHVNPDDQCSHVDMWATQGNDAADRCAAYAMTCLPAEVLRAVNSLLAEISYSRKLGRALHDMIIEIGARALQSTMPDNPLPQPAGLQPAPAPSVDAGLLHLSTLTIDDVPKKFHVRELQFILDWIKTLVSPSHTPQWVSFHQLLVDYQMFSNRWGPASSGPKWIESNRGEQYQYKQHVQWFSRFLKGISKSTGQEIKIEQRRPTSHVLAFWCGMVQVAIDEDKLRSIDDHYRSHCTSMPARQIERDLQDAADDIPVGKGGRQKRVLKESIQGITKPAIRRLARRGGVKRISGLIYEETRGVLKTFLENVLRDSITYTEHARRKTVTAMDITATDGNGWPRLVLTALSGSALWAAVRESGHTQRGKMAHTDLWLGVPCKSLQFVHTKVESLWLQGGLNWYHCEPRQAVAGLGATWLAPALPARADDDVPVGKGGRQRKVLKESIQGITKPAIRRLARRGDQRCSENVLGECLARFDYVHRARPTQDRHGHGHRLRSQAPGTHHLWIRFIGPARQYITSYSCSIAALVPQVRKVMCGILALFGLQDAGPLRKQVVEAAKLLRHRGPDWSGVYCEGSTIIAHERLAIVDPDSGDQPLFNEAKDIVLGVNGEIYNYTTLQDSLEEKVPGKHKFLTKSDCEVLLHLYAEDGIDFLSKNEVCGMYAFAIWDKKNSTYVVARDPVGIIPLYIGWGSDGSVQVASELKALHKADCDKSASTAPSQPPVDSQQVLSTPPPSTNSWDFTSFSHTTPVLQTVAYQLISPAFSKCGGTKVELLNSFLRAVSSTYQANAFHNFAHAVDVLQALCWQSEQINCDHLLNPTQQLAMVIAAVSVDLGHPGLDNAFLIDTGDRIAQCYNDFSPLENLHCSKLFELLKKDSLNVMSHLPVEDFREARSLIIDVILHTDKYRHTEVLNDVRGIARQGWIRCYAPKSADHSSPEGARALMRAMMVFSDLAHQARPLQASNTWATMLEQELSVQNEREHDLGLQVLPLNRWKPSRSDLQLHLALSRSGPLLGALLHIFPALAAASEKLADNARSWSHDCVAQEEVEGKPQTDGRAKKIESLLDPAFSPQRPAPAPVSEPKQGHDRFGYLGAARPYTGRQQRLTTSTIASTLSSNSPPASTVSTEPATSMLNGNRPPPPLVREVRRWQEGRGQVMQGNKAGKHSCAAVPFTLWYVLSDPDGRGPPISYRWVDRNSATLEESSAADSAVERGQRAASDDVFLESRKRRGSQVASVTSSPAVFHSHRSADAVVTTVEPSRFDDVLSSLLHGNMVVPNEGASNPSPAHRRASRTSAVISDVSAATRDRAAAAASVFSVLWRGGH